MYHTEKVIDVGVWDTFVEKTYGRPYSFQQQDGCKDRQRARITIPTEAFDYENDEVPEVVNHPKRGVSFEAWLSRDPAQPLNTEDEWERGTFALHLWWERNFYPHVEMIANDLYDRGLIEAGNYVIDIDW